MANSWQHYSTYDPSLSPAGVRSREWEGPSSWTEYLGPHMSLPMTSRVSRKKGGSDGQVQSSCGGYHKGLNLGWVVQLTEVAEGLMAKMYRLNQILDCPDPVGQVFSEAFWKAGVFPNYPRICLLLSKNFPEHFSKLQLERVDKVALDALKDGTEVHLQSLEPWFQVVVSYMKSYKIQTQGDFCRIPVANARVSSVICLCQDDSMMEKSMVTVTKSGSKVFQLHAVAWDGQGMGVIDIQRQKGDLFFLWLPGKMFAHFSTSALLLDLMAFREQALRLILDLSSTVITLLPHQNSLILHAFMDLFCSFVRVNLFSEKIPRKMMLQMYNLLHAMSRNDSDCDFYHRLVQFIDSYDPPLKGLQEDLKFVSPRIGEVLEAVGPVIFLSTDTRKLRNEGFLSPYHPRYPDILTNSAHPVRAQDLANVTSYREWVLLGYLVCPDELLRVTSIDIAL
ncbi:hypothetical protein NC652_035445, partial [Populus alba x Populus x berolinensis]